MYFLGNSNVCHRVMNIRAALTGVVIKAQRNKVKGFKSTAQNNCLASVFSRPPEFL